MIDDSKLILRQKVVMNITTFFFTINPFYFINYKQCFYAFLSKNEFQ